MPRYREPPFAKKDKDGHLVTSVEKLKQLCIETYTDRLNHEKIEPSLESLKVNEEKLFEDRRIKCKEVPLRPWTMKELLKVLRGLKKGKCQDPINLINEIFHPDVTGSDFLQGLLKLLNSIKKAQVFPKVFCFADILSIYKGKGDKTIFDKLLYNDKYETIDSNLTDSNVGARKSRNIRDN